MVVWLLALPAELREAVLDFLDHDALHAIERTHRALAETLSSGPTWEHLVRRGLTVAHDERPIDTQDWRRLACLLTRPSDPSINQLESVVGCSSMDREEESPQNTLEISQCWTTINLRSRRANSLFTRALLQLTHMNPQQVAQAECGCYGGSACYWSTTGELDPKTEDFIDYTVKPRTCVRQVQIMPYCAHWQPNEPTYGPVAVAVAFYKRPIDETATDRQHRELVYRSPEYALPNVMKVHECVLPTPVWLPHGAIMRLELRGRYQNGTFENDAHLFYTTLSFVGAVGVLDV